MFRQTYPLFKYWIYVYNYTCTKIRLFLSIPIHLNTIYKSIYILCQRRATSSTAGGEFRPLLLFTMNHPFSIDSVGLNVFQCMFQAFRSMWIAGTAATNITVCRMPSILLILSAFFDDNGGAGPTHKVLSSSDLCPPQGLLDMLAGPGGRRLRERLPPGKVAFPRSCQLPSARHPNGFSLFL